MHLGYHKALLVTCSVLTLLVTKKEAHLTALKGSTSTNLPALNGNNLIEYYLSRSTASSDAANNLISGLLVNPEDQLLIDQSISINNPQDSLRRQGLIEPDSSISNLAYINSQAVPRSGDLPFQKFLKQLELLTLDNSSPSLIDEDETDIYQFNDLNQHLPANGPLSESSISGPINDPADFEAALSHLTSTLNQEIPNTSNRSAILNKLLSSFISSIMKEVEHEEASKLLMMSLETNSTKNSNQIEASGTSASPPYRYGSSEYIDHPLALVGHQYVQGGAGEGKQLLGPDGTFENVQIIKSDDAIPSFCDPPNPCPIGYTADDGCLEKFINLASFSREYQVKQQCTCDNEHSLFNCASPLSSTTEANNYLPGSPILSEDFDEETNQPMSKQLLGIGGGDGDDFNLIANQFLQSKVDEENSSTNFSNQLSTLARAIQNRFGSIASIKNLIANHKVNQPVSADVDTK